MSQASAGCPRTPTQLLGFTLLLSDKQKGSLLLLPNHIQRVHSPVKVLEQWKKEVPSNRIEFIWARSHLHLRWALSKRKM